MGDESIGMSSGRNLDSEAYNSGGPLISDYSLTPVLVDDWDPGHPETLSNIVLPFHAIYRPFAKRWLESANRYWVMNKPITTLVSGVDPKTGKFIVDMEHAQFKWRIYRSYLDFKKLDYALRFYKHKKRIVARDFSVPLPNLPPFRKALQKTDDPLIRGKLEAYLRVILGCVELRSNRNTLTFCQVSFLSFDSDYGPEKGIEGYGDKRPGGYYGFRVRNCFRRIFMCWQNRWLVLKDSYLTYINMKTRRIGGVVLMDDSINATLITDTRITVKNKSRTFRLRFLEPGVAKAWLAQITEHITGMGRHDIRMLGSARYSADNIGTHMRRYISFVAPRPDSYGYWFVDGSGYFTALAEALYSAKKDIFICDWWLTPQLYLKRPLTEDCDKWRLDVILKKKAEEGIKIYILIFKEIPFALGLNSAYTESFIQDLHPYNIYILRHPDHVLSSVYLWSHHEKIVCIDQRVAFLGGLDICYGRWDDEEHRLTDIGMDKSQETMLGSQALPFPKSIYEMTKPEVIMKDDKILPAENRAGQTIKDRFAATRSRIFNFFGCRSKSVPNRSFKLNRPVPKSEPNIASLKMRAGGADVFRVGTNRSIRGTNHDEHTDIQELDFIGSGRYWIGKDYSNFIYKDFENVDEPFTDLIDRRKIPRMPWHDIAAMFYGKPAMDVSRHFIERWNQTVVEKGKKDDNFPLLLPKSYKVLPQLPEIITRRAIGCEIQICRSSSTWSAGIRNIEDSIHLAYIDIIAKSKYYVYIENQFFVSIHGHSSVLNLVGNAVYERIAKAIQNKEKFRVYIVLPLLPGFEGQIGERTGTFLQALIYWTNSSLSMGPNSLIQRLKKLVPDPFEYLSICGLRKYEILGDKLVTELIYVHSKLLIVDDEICLIGSANINDRSMLGDRDSEIAAVFRDNVSFVDGRMDGKVVQVGNFTASLRKRIFREHLFGHQNTSSGIDVDDPISDDFYRIWNTKAQSNSDIYDQIFRVIPSNNITNLTKLKEYKKEKSLAELDVPKAKNRLDGEIFGRLVRFPLDFLIEEGENLLTIPQSRLVAPLGKNSPFNIIFT